MLKRMIATLAALALARIRETRSVEALDFQLQPAAVATIIAQREPWLATLSASGPWPPSKA
jgi:hypothetical protein